MADDATTSPPIILAGDPAVRALLAAILADEGYRCLMADDERAAVALAEDDGTARLLMLDPSAPTSDGAAFCRACREHGGRAPIVLISDEVVGPELAAHYGADGYVAKPFDLEVLLETVARLAGPA